jgi:hypothetical protein
VFDGGDVACGAKPGAKGVNVAGREIRELGAFGLRRADAGAKIHDGNALVTGQVTLDEMSPRFGLG